MTALGATEANEHPFWVTGKETFVDAGELQLGDRVIGPQGELQTIASTTFELHPEGIPVFNFQVADYHTYYVNENGARARPLLVHNEGYTGKYSKVGGHHVHGSCSARRGICGRCSLNVPRTSVNQSSLPNHPDTTRYA